MRLSKFAVLLLLLVCISYALGCSSESKTLKIAPSKIDFSEVYIGNQKDTTVTLTNKYGTELTITKLEIKGSTDFMITSSISLPVSIEANADYNVTVSYIPITAGASVATLSIEHSESGKAVIADIVGTGLICARIEFSDQSYDFAKSIINQTHTHDVVIKNVGSDYLEITGLNFTGSGATAYKATATPITIDPGTDKTITITFEPTAIAQYDANLVIDHNAVNEDSQFLYTVKGEGIDVDPQITLSQSSPWDFGTVATILPSTQICEIENTGTDPLKVSDATLSTGIEFTIDSLKDSNGNVLSFPQTVAVGAKIMLAITFTPTANQKYSDTLSIVHDGTNEPKPLDVTLEGTGRVVHVQNFAYTGAIQQWTVPTGVTTITIECWGAIGGIGNGNRLPGKGAYIKGTISVTPGNVLQIVVGGKGGDSSYSIAGGGGGGGSFVYINDVPQIIAGGGGGGSYSGTGTGQDGGDTTAGGLGGFTSYPQTPGNGGYSDNGGGGGCGAGGGGWNTAGTGNNWCTGGAAKGGAGGHGPSSSYQNGGFGGAGGAMHGGGGGGGYTGGNGGTYTVGAGGGGSYNTGTNQTNTAGVRSGNGEVKITY